MTSFGAPGYSAVVLFQTPGNLANDSLWHHGDQVCAVSAAANVRTGPGKLVRLVPHDAGTWVEAMVVREPLWQRDRMGGVVVARGQRHGDDLEPTGLPEGGNHQARPDLLAVLVATLMLPPPQVEVADDVAGAWFSPCTDCWRRIRRLARRSGWRGWLHRLIPPATARRGRAC